MAMLIVKWSPGPCSPALGVTHDSGKPVGAFRGPFLRRVSVKEKEAAFSLGNCQQLWWKEGHSCPLQLVSHRNSRLSCRRSTQVSSWLQKACLVQSVVNFQWFPVADFSMVCLQGCETSIDCFKQLPSEFLYRQMYFVPPACVSDFPWTFFPLSLRFWNMWSASPDPILWPCIRCW